MKAAAMVLMSLVLVGFAFAESIESTRIGFTGGPEFRSTPISGQIHLQCNEGGQFADRFYSCYDVILLPFEYDYFVGPVGMDADTVSLTSVRQDGSVKSKSQPYDSTQGKSTSRFNLWIRTLTQSPLLQEGLNTVSYILTKTGAEKSRGQFQVKVVRGPAAQCQGTGFYTSPTMQDCNVPSAMCARFFRERGYCLP